MSLQMLSPVVAMMPPKQYAKLFFSATRNAHENVYSYVLKNGSQELQRDIVRLPTTTRLDLVEAEYMGLISGFKSAIHHSIDYLNVYSDSYHVIKQMKSPFVSSQYSIEVAQARSLEKQFYDVAYYHITPARNLAKMFSYL